MKLAVFGGSGRAGRQLVTQALVRGHEVTALARDAQRLAQFGEWIEVIEGDVQDAAAVARVVAGADAVISVLGPTVNRPDYQVSRGMAHILAAMKEHGVQRLVVSVGAGVRDAQDEPKLLDRFIKGLVMLLSRHVYEDMRRTAELVRASDLDWSIVRVPMLTDAAGSRNVSVGYVGKGTGPRLSRADMAAFMLDQVESGQYVRQAPVISN